MPTIAQQEAIDAAAALQQTMIDNLAAVQQARDSGLARDLLKIGGFEKEKWYRTDAELMAEIASLNRRLGNVVPPTKMVVRSTKGW
jgi:hypothetical protein